MLGCSDSVTVKMVVYLNVLGDTRPINFSCDISTRVDHVVSHVVCELGPRSDELRPEKYTLKVWGLAEFISPESSLSDYEYVHRCIKLERGVRLCLLHVNDVPKPLLRTTLDDVKDVELQVKDLFSRESADAPTHSTICVVLGTIHSEVQRLIGTSQTQPTALIQSSKGTVISFINNNLYKL